MIGCRHFRRMLKDALWAGIVNEPAIANETLQHGSAAPGAETIRNA